MRTEPVVWIIGRQQWPRALLRAELMQRGLDAVGYVEPAQALAAVESAHVGRPDVVVLDLRELGLTRPDLEGLARLGVPTVLLGGAAELNQPLLEQFEWATVIRRPCTIGAVADAVEKLSASGRQVGS